MVIRGVHPVAPVVIGDGFFVGLPLDVESGLGDLAVGSIRSRATALRLLEAVFLADGARDFEVASDGVAIENRLDLEIDLSRAAQACLGPGKAHAQLLEFVNGDGDVSAPTDFLAQGEQGAPDPDHGPGFGGE